MKNYLLSIAFQAGHFVVVGTGSWPSPLLRVFRRLLVLLDLPIIFRPFVGQNLFVGETVDTLQLFLESGYLKYSARDKKRTCRLAYLSDILPLPLSLKASYSFDVRICTLKINAVAIKNGVLDVPVK